MLLDRVPHLVLVAFGAVVFCAVSHRILLAFWSPLRDVPGPFLARITRLWYIGHLALGNFHEINVQLHQKYGPIVRIAPNEYSIDDPEAVNVIYGHGTKFIKSPWYRASGVPGRSNLFSERNPENHARSRRNVAGLYSMGALLKMEVAVDDCIRCITPQFDHFASTGNVIDMKHWLQCFAFDLIGLITVSKRFGFLDQGEDVDNIMGSIHDFLRYMVYVGVYSEWHHFLLRLIAVFGATGRRRIVEFTQSRIQERLQQQNNAEKQGQGDDFLAKALAIHRNSPDKFSIDDVLSTCIGNVAAGSDTTSISLSAVLYNLIRNPETLRKLREEISTGYTKGNISDPITYQEAQNLPYLQAVIKEALRLHPATGLPLGRVVPASGSVVAGVFCPGGTVVGVNTWVAHANTSVFGPDADSFRPERWLENEERALKMGRYWLPFGSGSRTCIGKNISLLEISKLIPKLIMRYDFSLEGVGSEMETENVWFVIPVNFKCRVSIRKVQGESSKALF